MKKILYLFGSASGISLFQSKRNVYQKGPDALPPMPTAETAENAEKQNDPVNILAAAERKLMEQENKLEATINANKNSSNPAIQAAATEAGQKLQDLRAERAGLAPEEMGTNIQKINNILGYFETYVAFERAGNFLDENKKTAILKWNTGVNQYLISMLSVHKNISPEAKNRLYEIASAAQQDGKDQIVYEMRLYEQNGKAKVSFDDYQANTNIFTEKMDTIADTNNKLTGVDPTMQNALDQIALEEYQPQMQAVVAIDIAKDVNNALTEAERSKQGAITVLGKSFQVESATYNNGVTQIAAITKQAENTLKMLKGTGNAPKRALVLAQMKDGLVKVATASNENSSLYTDTVAEMLNYKKDVYAKGFEKGKQRRLDVNMDKGNTFVISGSPNLRMEGTGVQLLVLKPGAAVEVMDGGKVMRIAGEKGPVDYVEVRDVETGVVGYVEKSHVDFNRPVTIKKDKPEPQKNVPADSASNA